jgi:uncharacterized protein
MEETSVRGFSGGAAGDLTWGAGGAHFSAMKLGVIVLLAVALGVGVFGARTVRTMAADAAENHRRSVEAVRAKRVAELTAPDGWLTLIGLHFLPAGESTVGSAKDNAVVLAAGPAHLGRANVGADGKVSFALAAGVDALIDGQPLRAAELKTGEGKIKPTLVTAGPLSVFAIERGGKKALRVRDSAAERRARFAGLEYFPVDAGWRIEARWEAFERSRLLPITNALGQTAPEPVPGRAVFERDGKTYALLAIDEGRDAPLFFVFADATSGNATYGGGRFLYVDWPKEGETKITLDFNLAENPPCVFTPYATCPLPPKENRLAIAVVAGERNLAGGHE